MTEKTILTPEGKKQLENELTKLLEKRKLIASTLTAAKELGDLSENAEYHAAREDQSFNEGKIQDIERMLKSAEVITRQKGATTIQLGSTVTLLVDEREITYTIVGSNETSIEEKKISIESPVAKALLEKREGETVMVVMPAGTKKYKIIKVE